MSFYRFGQGWQVVLPKGAKIELVGMPNDPNPLPFDDLPINTSPDLLERLEELQPMSYERLDSAGISASQIRRDIVNDEYHNDGRYGWSLWESWKRIVCSNTGKTWPEIAPIIYHNY